MTDKKTEELNEAELDQVAGGGDTVRQYNLENAWPTRSTSSTGLRATGDGKKVASTAGTNPEGVVASGGGNGI